MVDASPKGYWRAPLVNVSVSVNASASASERSWCVMKSHPRAGVTKKRMCGAENVNVELKNASEYGVGEGVEENVSESESVWAKRDYGFHLTNASAHANGNAPVQVSMVALQFDK